MSLTTETVSARLSRYWKLLKGNIRVQTQSDNEMPLRAELYSADQMKTHGKTMAGMHKVTSGLHRESLLTRLSENENVLLEVYDLLTEDVKADRLITPAGEWLLDNFYLIEEQIRTAKHHFPKSYSRELPNLLNGPSAGFPRVYDIALETVSHGDGRIDPENLSSFVSAYQSVLVLKLGELWAIPIMLRLALMENLRRVAARIAADRMYRKNAEFWANQMTEIAAKDPKSLILAIADMARSNPPMVSAFVAELAHKLQGQVPGLSLPLTWIEQRLSESGLTIEQMVRSENQQLAADQVSMSNSIGSLRFLGAMDWREFVESMSMVETTLKEDPADVYGKMDFATRDSYRHIIEKVAKSCHQSENEVAHIAIQLAQAGAQQKGGDDRITHVGYYLIDKGLPLFKRAAKMRITPNELLVKYSQKNPSLFYISSILFLTSIFTAFLLLQASSYGIHGWIFKFHGLLILIGTGHLAVALVNWLATMLATPRLLPRMDFSKGIPEELRTLVIVPTMLTGMQEIEELTKALEVRFLANSDNYIHYGLLTDFRDATTESLPEDEPLVQFASQKIAELNALYPNPDYDIFFLFHRPRRWNPKELIWMGYERKRGKLSGLNGFLRGRSEKCFSHIVGNVSVLKDVKYIITLDTDTQLVRDSAKQFIGTMAHPLNHPQYDAKHQRVVDGYGILQPRVAVSLPGANRSLYARLGASEPGIDPYTRTVSDVYQDLFGEGSFIGKGIYDVDAFEQSLSGQFPENRILSHDLLEGSYARAGLLSDVQLYEEYPSRYNADVNRRHRWIRGDWQIAQWIMPLVPGVDAHLKKNPLSLLSRWKIFDNLRRSMTAIALTLVLLLGWLVLPAAWLWTLAVISIIAIPALAASALNILRKPVDVTLREHLAIELRSVRLSMIEATLTLVCLPYEAFYSLDAVVRTVWRILISHKHLLEWNPSGESDKHSRTTLSYSFSTMWIAPFISIATVITLIFLRPQRLEMAAPILLLWFASPVITWWISRPLTQREAKLTANQINFLRRLSRKTWAFFETFVTAEHNWLPPDNFQEHPVAVVAHRTSPTNMGLALLANLAAYDFGTISAGQLINRTDKAIHTMENLDKYHGHLYNWYDTQTLKALYPLYISSVDSGNLAGHLITLQNGLLGLIDDRILSRRWFESLNDTLEILADAAADMPELHVMAQLTQLRQKLEYVKSSDPTTLVS